ncbi:MAG: hypothetical protein ABI142_07460, partial [Bryocella sp.]
MKRFAMGCACDNRSIVYLLKTLPAALLALTLFPAIGCHAQSQAKPATTAETGKPLSLELSRRVEVLMRQKANLPPGSTLIISGRTPSQFPGWDTISVTVDNGGHTSHPIPFLLSADGKHMAQMTEFDIAANPRTMLSQGDRPSRGGPTTAPVLIV